MINLSCEKKLILRNQPKYCSDISKFIKYNNMVIFQKRVCSPFVGFLRDPSSRRQIPRYSRPFQNLSPIQRNA